MFVLSSFLCGHVLFDETLFQVLTHSDVRHLGALPYVFHGCKRKMKTQVSSIGLCGSLHATLFLNVLTLQAKCALNKSSQAVQQAAAVGCKEFEKSPAVHRQLIARVKAPAIHTSFRGVGLRNDA